MKKYETIIYEKPEPGLGILTLNRPASYNAINQAMVSELHSFWGERLYDLETRVIVLRGSGEKGFCTGLDVKETGEITQKMGLEEFYIFQAGLARLNLAMRRAPQPIICCVHGAAAGLGLSFALASDIRIVSPDARFSAAYINIGLGGADMSCSYFLPRMIGAGRAYEYMYTGEFFSAEDACRLGMVSRIVERVALLDTALEYAATLLKKNPFGLRLTKEAVNMNIDAPGLEHALNMEDRNQTLLAVGTFLKNLT
ncbi:MAG TPA: enoyl-CoA hydratase/isomerase family protein [Spirochaetota bacterium]|nr:enoyl-CoA hydratase/isomerase family protein [Spirochaetota bacterium]